MLIKIIKVILSFSWTLRLQINWNGSLYRVNKKKNKFMINSMHVKINFDGNACSHFFCTLYFDQQYYKHIAKWQYCLNDKGLFNDSLRVMATLKHLSAKNIIENLLIFELKRKTSEKCKFWTCSLLKKKSDWF